MPWVRVDDGINEHPKIAALDDHAFSLFVAGLVYCNRNLTDGFIPSMVGVGQLRWCEGDAVPAIRQLESAGLWEEVPGGWQVHDYLDYQRSKAEIVAEREAARSRMAEVRGKRVRGSGGVRPNNGRTSDSPTPNPKPTDSGLNSGDNSNARDTQRVGDSKAPAVIEHPEAHRLCHLLADLIEANGSKRPRVTQRWLREARLLLDQDRRSVAQAEDLLRWSQENEFWKANILSMPKFREKYDQLRLQENRNGEVPKSKHLADRLMESALRDHERKEASGQGRGESPRSPTPRSLPG